jgi:hypothetical protein
MECQESSYYSRFYFVSVLPDRELLAAKLKLESDLMAQRSVTNENRNRVEMLENVLAKETVTCTALCDYIMKNF